MQEPSERLFSPIGADHTDSALPVTLPDTSLPGMNDDHHLASFLKLVNHGDDLYRRHLNCQESGSFLTQALNRYAMALEQHPTAADALCKIARTHYQLGNQPQAAKNAKAALDMLRPGQNQSLSCKAIRGQAHLILANVCYQQGDLKQAARHYRKSADVGGLDGTLAHFGLFKIHREEALLKSGLWKALWQGFGAAYHLTASLMLFPFCRERQSIGELCIVLPQLMLGWMQEESGNKEAAISRYLKLYEQFPGFAHVCLMIGELHRDQQRPEESRYWFQKALDRHPGHLDAQFHMARLLEEQEEYPEMIALYEELVKRVRNDAHLHCNLANAYYYTQNYKEALTHYTMALQLGTNAAWKAMIAQCIGNLHSDYLNNPDAAIACYQLALELEPTDLETHIQLGTLYFQKDDFANAELVYRKAIDLDPENPRLYSNLGYLRWMENDVPDAIQLYEKAISLDCGYEIPVNNLGVIYLDMLGQVHTAIEYFEQALTIDPDYALAYYNLGRAYSFLDLRLEAAHCFHRAQELNLYTRELDNDELTARINHLFDTCEMEVRD